MRRQYGTLGETRNTMNTRNDNNGRISLTNSDYNTNNNRNNDFLMLPEEEERIENNFSESEKAQQEWYHILANRLRYTQGYILFYMFVLILGVITSGFVFLRIDAYYQEMVKGAIIVGAVVVDQIRYKKKNTKDKDI